MVFTCDFQSQGQTLNAYTDSRYAFHILPSCHLEGSWTTYNKRRNHNSEQIMALLKDSYVLTAIGIIPCESHQNDNSIVSKGNKGANEVAKVVTLRGQTHLSHSRASLHYNPHPRCHPPTLALDKFCPIYTSSFILTANSASPRQDPPTAPEDLHLLRAITATCKVCQMPDSNSSNLKPPFPTPLARGSLPGTDWQFGLNHMPSQS